MLTRKQKEFVKNYIITKNATKSAALSGYSERTARQAGSRLLSISAIRKDIDAYFESCELTKEDIIRSIGEISKNGKTETNKLRALELLARINKLMQDSAPQQVAIFQDFSKQLDSMKEDTVKDVESEPVKVEVVRGTEGQNNKDKEV